MENSKLTEMKRLTMIMALLLTVTMPMRAERVSPETARKVATTFFSNNGVKADNLTDLSKSAGFQNLYIFNAKPGFVVMAADDCVKPILGYSFDGTFVAEDMPENISGWLQDYNDDIQYAIDNKLRASDEDSQLWKALTAGKGGVAGVTRAVEPLIQTQWDQKTNYNGECPIFNGNHANTGCVATAMAQIMKYWEYPSHGIGSHSYSYTLTLNNTDTTYTYGADFGETNYDWVNMTSTYNNTSTQDEKNAVAKLMYHCGVSIDMRYSANSSGATTSHVGYALKTYFNYSSNITYKKKKDYGDNEWEGMLKGELNEERPLQYRGGGYNGGGHSFVCDGYDILNNKNYFHFNWGWSGIGDGYFTLSSLKPTNVSNDYKDKQAAIFGIEPQHCAVGAPTNLTSTVSGRNVTLSWKKVPKAVSYIVYRNGYFMGEVTTNSYSGTASFGANQYYVCSVDKNGQRSFSSNTVSFNVNTQDPVVNDLEASLMSEGNEARLTWTASTWCYPEVATTTLTRMKDDEDIGYDGNSDAGYAWAHRFLTDTTSKYANKAVYKVSFFASETGTHHCYVYKGTDIQNNNIFKPKILLSEKSIDVSRFECWNWVDIELDSLATVDGSQDLWIVLYYPGQSGQNRYPAAYNSQNDDHGKYWGLYGSGEDRAFQALSNKTKAYLIRTYITDGTYSYNLYDNGTLVGSNIETTRHTVTKDVANLDNNKTHQFTVKTNINNGQTAASNKAGFTLGNATEASLSLSANDKMTVKSGTTLTVTGTLSTDNAANLVIEDGAQLIHNTASVSATVKKNITARSTVDNVNKGWTFIASPLNTAVNPFDADLITDTLESTIPEGQSSKYDLYRFNQSENAEWQNYRIHAEDFVLENGKGYLYANADNVALNFEGIINKSETEISVGLEYDEEARFPGWNLVGNPFTCNAYVNMPYYTLDADGTAIANTTTREPVSPCTGIMVHVEEDRNIIPNIIFSKTSPTMANNGSVQMAVAQQVMSKGEAQPQMQDNAIVSFNEGNHLEKFVFNADASKLYIPQNGKDYAIISVGRDMPWHATEIPVNFEATENGTYTISVNPEGVEMSYLHLIDNLTGTDIDLLSPALQAEQSDPDQPVTYTFTAKTTDYASRFKLVFSTVNDTDVSSTDSETFAYVNNGEIIITGTNGNTTLQIVDMTGRVVVSRVGDATNRVSTNEMTPGVYVLRLIDGNDMKTQKLVVK